MQEQNKQFRKRNAILACLCSTKRHPSAEWIFHRLKPEYPDLSLGTVYRNLTLFKQQGTIASLGVVNGVERFDGCVTPHFHFVCRGCGRIEDLSELQVPPELLRQVEEGMSCRVDGCQLSFFGECSACQDAEHH